ncbi:MAG: class I SAM-dependent methyltransferase [Candidatus Aminicenantes bacterium]
MPKIEPFEKDSDSYDAWFDRHRDIFDAELQVVRLLMPPFEKGVEIGVGTGRFAVPVGIEEGVEPSKKMAEKAEKRGVRVHAGTAENLPLPDEKFDLALMVTTVCFLDDILQSFREAHRVLKKGGYLMVGFINKDSELGKKYQRKRRKSRFYKEAVFVPAETVLEKLQNAGFKTTASGQTLIPGEPPSVIREGFGEGSFVVLKSVKTGSPQEADKNHECEKERIYEP